MRRVVVTGMGIVSCLGNDLASVASSLLHGRPGIRRSPSYAERGLRSQVAGRPDIDLEAEIDRRDLRFMGDAAAYAAVAMRQAVADSGLDAAQVSNPRTGLIAGSGGGSSSNIVEAADIARSRGVRKIGPTRVPRTMCSTVAACLGTAFRIKGLSYSVSSACATSAHCIGVAAEQIMLGNQDIVFCGGGEEEHWTLASLFDAMGALSAGYNETPERASRAYDARRDGFVIAEGAAVLVLEDYEIAKQRGANILAEIAGYGMSGDAFHITQPDPDGDGAARAMKMALRNSGLAPTAINYINAHGTSTPYNDRLETVAIKKVLGEHAYKIPVSSTKSMIGHSLGAAGAIEAVICILAMRDSKLPPTMNHFDPDPDCDLDYVPNQTRNGNVDVALSNSFGFGGHNVTLIFKKV